MRVKYIKPDLPHYLRYYKSQAGFGDLVFRGARYQRGTGIGSFLASLGRYMTPFIRPVLSALGKQALSTGARVFSDVTSGRDIKESLRSRLKEGGSDLLSQAAEKLRGRGIKRKKPGKKRISVKRSRRDIFAAP